MIRKSLLAGWPVPLFLVLASLLLWPALFTGRALVPAELLRYVAPWEQETKPLWNPLRYDSVGQFYPWRLFAGEELRTGRIPLWNPYQFSGTPFVANSQSAVFYPGNILYWLLPTAAAAGLTAMLHLSLASFFMFAFLREQRVSPIGSAVGAIAFAFSGWQLAWILLPTFLMTSCWLPLLLLTVSRLWKRQTLSRALAFGATAGMTLLAGHLQIAFYSFLAVAVFAIWLCMGRAPSAADAQASTNRLRRLRFAALLLAGFTIAGMFAAPQLLPSLELSRRSHRVAPVSSTGYSAYTAYAVHPASIATIFLPDYYDSSPDGRLSYSGVSRGGSYFNHAEGALYVGIPTILLSMFALLRSRQIGRKVWLFAVLAILALLLATGSFVDAILYFYVPGFGQSGSPGRALVLWSFALAGLAAVGCDKLIHDDATPVKTAIAGTVIVFALFALTVAAAPIGAIGGAAPAGRFDALPRQLGLSALSAGVIVALASGKFRNTKLNALPVAIVAVDLLAAGANQVVTASPDDLYPSRPLIQELSRRSGHDRIMPVNQGWSFAGPRAILPPNGAMVFGLRDVQGYDSLFPGQYKAIMNTLSGRDSSPPEVGNMVFAKDPLNPLAAALGVRTVVSLRPLAFPDEVAVDGAFVYDLPGAVGRASFRGSGGASTHSPIVWLEDSPTRVRLTVEEPSAGALILADQRYPGWLATVDGIGVPINPADSIFRSVDLVPGKHVVEFRFEPSSYRIGIYLAAAVLCLTAGAFSMRRTLSPRMN